MTAKQRNRKHQQRLHHQNNKQVHGRNYNEDRGLHAADLYIDVLFGRREGRIDD